MAGEDEGLELVDGCRAEGGSIVLEVEGFLTVDGFLNSLSYVSRARS